MNGSFCVTAFFSQTVVCYLNGSFVCRDVGETDGLQPNAKASGASQLVVHDLKEEFVKDSIYLCLPAGAFYERKYLLGTLIARPIISKFPIAECVWTDLQT